MLLFNLLTENAGNSGGNGGGNNYTMLIILGVLIVAFIVMTAVQNKNRKKQAQEDQARKDKLCSGTTVITIGGIMGRVVSVNNEENSFVLDTEGTKMKFDKRAIYQMQLPKKVEEELKREQEALAQAKLNKKTAVKEQLVKEEPVKEETATETVEEKAE